MPVDLFILYFVIKKACVTVAMNELMTMYFVIISSSMQACV